jgi:hypothetical protein
MGVQRNLGKQGDLEIRRKNKKKGRETYLKQCLSWDTDILSANVRPTLLNMNAM